MLDSGLIKKTAKALGADLCGIAAIDRFRNAPEGFHPTDIYDACKSVLVFARKLPSQALFLSNCVPYTFVNTAITQEVDRLTMDISLKLEEHGIRNVPVPSDDPYEHWEADRSYGRAILSLRHAGRLAGLGVLGKNTLLINEKYGNMIQIGAILLEKELKGDPIAEYEACPEECHICLESCPPQALDGRTVNQKLCRPLSNYKNEKGYVLKKCSACRSACPHALGIDRNVRREGKNV